MTPQSQRRYDPKSKARRLRLSSDHDTVMWLRYGRVEKFLPAIVLTSTIISGFHGNKQ